MSEQVVQLIAVRDGVAEVRVRDRVHFIPYLTRGTEVSFAFDGEIYTVDVSEQGGRRRARHRDHSMSAPMPGVVLKIFVKQGDVVSKGTPLVVLEAMKMEHQIVATHEGTVVAVNCREGELVQPGAELVEVNGNR
jgi:3-methylcrotonyl-CoA carboxylase alpha subunit